MRELKTEELLVRLEEIQAAVSDPNQPLDSAAVLSCGGVNLKRGALDEKLLDWEVTISLPHEETLRSYRLNRQSTEMAFHLILRKENLN